MMNLVNIGFEHEVRVSIDNHKLAVVANDGGFVRPEVADVRPHSPDYLYCKVFRLLTLLLLFYLGRLYPLRRTRHRSSQTRPDTCRLCNAHRLG